MLLKLALVRALGSGFVLGTFAFEEALVTDPSNLKPTMTFALKYKDQSGDYYFIVSCLM